MARAQTATLWPSPITPQCSPAMTHYFSSLYYQALTDIHLPIPEAHIAWLTQGTPAHNALYCQVGLASGRSLGRDWRHHPGRPRVRWTDQLRNDTGSVPVNLWRQTAILLERRDGPSWLRDDDDDEGLKAEVA